MQLISKPRPRITAASRSESYLKSIFRSKWLHDEYDESIHPSDKVHGVQKYLTMGSLVLIPQRRRFARIGLRTICRSRKLPPRLGTAVATFSSSTRKLLSTKHYSRLTKPRIFKGWREELEHHRNEDFELKVTVNDLRR